MRPLASLFIVFAPMLSAADPTYTKDVAPILSDRCSGCHLAKGKMGGLSLETYAGLMQGGSTGQAVIPGKSQESRLYLMIAGKISPAMPMNSTQLSSTQIEAIRAWIDAGAIGGAEPPKTKSLPPIAPQAGLKPQVFDLAYAPDGKLVALAGFKIVRLVNAATMQDAYQLNGHADAVRAVAFSRDGKFLAAAGGLPGRSGEVKIWNTADRTVLRTIEGHSDCLYAVAFSPDGKSIATAGYDKVIKLWDVGTGQEIRTFQDHIDAIYTLAFTPDGKRLISGAADRTIKIWDVATAQRLYTLSEPQDGINVIALDPTGKLLAAGGLDKSIRIWELGGKSGTLLHTLIAHEDAILRLAWSPDGALLVSSSADRTVKVFHAADLSEAGAYPEPDWVYGLGWSPDGKTIAIERFDGTGEKRAR